MNIQSSIQHSLLQSRLNIDNGLQFSFFLSSMLRSTVVKNYKFYMHQIHSGLKEILLSFDVRFFSKDKMLICNFKI